MNFQSALNCSWEDLERDNSIEMYRYLSDMITHAESALLLPHSIIPKETRASIRQFIADCVTARDRVVEKLGGLIF